MCILPQGAIIFNIFKQLNYNTMNELINMIKEDINKSKEMLNAFEQECNLEGIAFNKGVINALECVLLDIKLTIKL